MTFTCKIGKFVFTDETALGIAKLIRDTVQAQFLMPKDGRHLRDANDCIKFVQEVFKDRGDCLEHVVLT